MRNALVAAVAVALLAALEAAYFFVRWLGDRRSAELKRRLQAIGRPGSAASTLLRPGRLAATPALARLVAAVPGARRLEALLEHADAPLTVAQLLSTCLALGGVASFLALAIRAEPLVVLVVPLLAGTLPVLALLVRRSRRGHQLSEQLPEALDMMSRSLRAGHALPAAFEMVASEMPQPISLEFARAFEEQKLGRSLEEAVQRMAERAPGNGDLKIFAVSAVIQRETGGNLAEMLGKIAETIRQRYRFQGKLRALTAEGRVSGFILGALPFGVALLISITNHGYFARLFDNEKGQAILTFAIVIWLAGIFWMYQLTQLEV
ncbi:MAG TPA: type II secretion system F family protein [Anaeromyxobacter sp.]